MRNEYPRPDFVRDSFVSLNKEWEFDFDDSNVGHSEKWFIKHKFSKKINVPFAFQSELSGINDQSFHDNMWYKTTFKVAELDKEDRLIIYFDGIDYYSEVYINGFRVKDHFGGNVGFKVDVTDYLITGTNELVIYVNDPSSDTSIPRGKQDWEEKSHAIFYTRTSGIYKSVYYQIVNQLHLDNYLATTNINTSELKLNCNFTKDYGKFIVRISNHDEWKEFEFAINNQEQDFTIKLSDFFILDKLWDVHHPFLFDLELIVKDNQDKITDKVKSYVGFRKVSIEDGKVLINDRPVYQKLILNQGYYPKGILTASSIEELEQDILNMKAMGFNGCRIHQKCEDPYFLYLCDKLGFYVWQECASAYRYTSKSPKRMINEWIDIIKTYHNHPSIIAYTPLNESWGVEGIPYHNKIQAHAMSLYYLIKSIDDSRLVISNDGWEHCKTDLLTVHNYAHGNKDEIEKYELFKKHLKTREQMISYENINRFIINPNFKDEGQPVLLTEFGGVAFKKDAKGIAWGYTTSSNEQEFVDDLTRIYEAIKESECICGICYTQYTDVEQEVNGLMTFDRKFKVDPEIIKKINDSIN